MSSPSIERLEVHHLAIAAPLEPAVRVEHVRHAAAHAGGEVAAGPAEDHHAAAGHVLAAVVAHAFDDHGRAAVAHAETLARHAADVAFAAGRAVERHVADDDVLLRLEGGRLRRIRDQPAAGKPLAEAVVRVADERQRHAARHERAEALARRPGEGDPDRVVRQPLAAVPPGHLIPEHRADRAIRVPDERGQLDRRADARARACAA